MVFDVIDQFPQASVYTLQEAFSSAQWDKPAAVLTTDRNDEPLLERLAAALGSNLLLPEVWCEIFPQTGCLISSSLSGGTLQHRFSEAVLAYPHRCWLLLESMSAVFPLPCLSGAGQDAHDFDRSPGFYSEALCCMYSHFLQDNVGYMALWDTEQTLRHKISLAQEIGFCGFVAAQRQD